MGSETDTFEEKELHVLTCSEPYRISQAFRDALSYIAQHNTGLYRKLIETEHQSMTEA